jgi:murein DD-endopeptidase MepM/ murein hydrolase activator NlpD
MSYPTSAPHGAPEGQNGQSRRRGMWRRVRSFIRDVSSFLRVLPQMLRRRTKRHFTPQFVKYREVPQDTFSRFLKQSAIVGVALLVITSFAPSTLLEVGVSADFFEIDSDYIPEETIDDAFLPETQDGYFSKLNPHKGEFASRVGFSDKVTHTVQKGETLSEISKKYGVSTSTLMWENDLGRTDHLSIGQTLVIPPVDGLTVTVGKGDTLGKIAADYDLSVSVIMEYNGLEGDLLRNGQELFLPGAEPKAPPTPVVVSRTPVRTNTRTVTTPKPTSTNTAPKTGKKLIYPTIGQMTRGFQGGHYGDDIADTSRPSVWAAAAGKVIKSSGGCPSRDVAVSLGCGGGYGNHVVIDHGNGLHTLYGHMDALYVTVGQQVTQGQPIGQMGNSGRVYGPTGIHLHFEVIDNGVKRNPGLYY